MMANRLVMIPTRFEQVVGGQSPPQQGDPLSTSTVSYWLVKLAGTWASQFDQPLQQGKVVFIILLNIHEIDLTLQNIKINDGGYIFLISSNVIKEPNSKLIISSAYRAAFAEVFKVLSKEYAQKNISCINIAPGPINTDRTQELIKNVKEFEKTLPMKRLGEPEEIGNFVKSIIQNNIKYLSGVTINFDGANSNYIF